HTTLVRSTASAFRTEYRRGRHAQFTARQPCREAHGMLGRTRRRGGRSLFEGRVSTRLTLTDMPRNSKGSLLALRALRRLTHGRTRASRLCDPAMVGPRNG